MAIGVINTNVASLIAQRNLQISSDAYTASMEKISSGYRINKAEDDPAGLTIAETLQGQILNINTALQNVQDGNSTLQIADGTLSVVTDNLQRIRELTVQAANDTNSSAQRLAIENEIQSRLNDNQRIVQAATFNGVNLLTGSAKGTLLQVGPNASTSMNTINIGSALGTATATAMGLLGATTSTHWNTVGSIDFTNGDKARAFLNDIDRALSAVSQRRSLIGALQNQLGSATKNLQMNSENFSASESRIRDVNIASETSNLTKNQILEEASVSILSQANQAPQMVLKLLG